MANVTGTAYKVTAGEAAIAGLGLAVALALAWISLDLLAGGRLTLAFSRSGLPPLRVVKDNGDGDDETVTG